MRRRVRVRGIVQGVGFRPFVFRLATEMNLAGWVLNDSQGVLAEAEGDAAALDEFERRLTADAPPLSVVNAVESEPVPAAGGGAFEVRSSESLPERTTLISPDAAICADCLRELFDPADRRHRYPFINCTNCGPRYTIIMDIPYDRPATTMSSFTMCADCLAEYRNPADRRFHAQPNACPVCGPKVRLLDADGGEVASPDPVREAAKRLVGGAIVAIKGLGGYHLACNATSDEAVTRLRARKTREEKPLAVMTRDLDAARRVASLTPEAEALLSSWQAPIVLLPKRPGHGLAEGVAPRSRRFGVMLPYTPLHHLLLADGPPALVMTSGNLSEEPIAYEDGDAISRLAKIADLFLVHDRPIYIRTDDSVVSMTGAPAGGTAKSWAVFRRSRGYAPRPVTLGRDLLPILAVGPELKSTICLARGREAFLSHHIGDLTNPAALGSFRQAVGHLARILLVEPRACAHDLHTAYLSTRWALEESGLPALAVQHHHAHVVSCLAENGYEGRAIGVALDGTGYGEDGTVWGGEFLDAAAGSGSFRRLGHLRPVPMPGGDRAVLEPGRMLLSYLRAAQFPDERLARLVPLEAGEIAALDRMIERGVNAPLTSSTGRMFDAVSALLGVCRRATYEGQPAIELEGIADEREAGSGAAYEAMLSDGDEFTLDGPGLVARAAEDALAGTSAPIVAARFHASVAEAVVRGCERAREMTDLATVALSGGVLQNVLLRRLCIEKLGARGFRVLVHAEVPPNDGGVSLGQLVVADAILRERGEA